MKPGEQIVLQRNCDATQIPSGVFSVLPAGSRVRLMQALGGSYTVLTDQGYIARIEAKDADALGIARAAVSPESKPEEFSEKAVWDLLRTVYDPEIPVNIVDLGLIYSCEITPGGGGNRVDISMAMTAPGCGMGDILRSDIERRLAALPGVGEVHVQIVFEPAWNPGRMTEAARLQLGLDLEGSNSPVYGK